MTDVFAGKLCQCKGVSTTLTFDRRDFAAKCPEKNWELSEGGGLRLEFDLEGKRSVAHCYQCGLSALHHSRFLRE
jgi:hypothetical protein